MFSQMAGRVGKGAYYNEIDPFITAAAEVIGVPLISRGGGHG